MWYEIVYTRRTWPRSLQVTLETYQSRNGPRVAGVLFLGLQKGDTDQFTPLNDAQGNAIEAHIEADTPWVSPNWDCSDLSRQGYDTLVVYEANRTPVYRTLTRQQQPAGQNQPAQNAPQPRQAREPKTVIEFNGYDLLDKDGGKKVDIILTGIINRDNAPLQQAQIDFFYKGRLEQACQLPPGCKTDDNGRFSFTFADKQAEGKRVPLEVQIHGTAARRKFEVELPKAPKELEPLYPASLTARVVHSEPSGDKLRHLISVNAQDQHGKPIAAGQVLWSVGPESPTNATIDLPEEGDLVTVEVAGDTFFNAMVRAWGLMLPDRIKLEGPKKQSKPIPASLQATALMSRQIGDEVEHYITISAKGKDGNFVEAGETDWMCGGDAGRVFLGSRPHSLAVRVKKEKSEFQLYNKDFDLSLKTPLALEGPKATGQAMLRMVIDPSAEEIQSAFGDFSITIKTFGKDGKTPSEGRVLIESPESFTAYNQSAGVVLCRNANSCVVDVKSTGVANIFVQLSVFAAELVFTHQESGQKLTRKLQVT